MRSRGNHFSLCLGLQFCSNYGTKSKAKETPVGCSDDGVGPQVCVCVYPTLSSIRVG
jgi:hypothetical protein